MRRSALVVPAASTRMLGTGGSWGVAVCVRTADIQAGHTEGVRTHLHDAKLVNVLQLIQGPDLLACLQPKYMLRLAHASSCG